MKGQRKECIEPAYKKGCFNKYVLVTSPTIKNQKHFIDFCNARFILLFGLPLCPTHSVGETMDCLSEVCSVGNNTSSDSNTTTVVQTLAHKRDAERRQNSNNNIRVLPIAEYIYVYIYIRTVLIHLYLYICIHIYLSKYLNI